MANYKEQVVTGEYSEYQRSNKVIITNELGGMPEITFMEQVLAALPNGQRLQVKQDKCVDQLLDPAETFNLLNPTDDSIIGTAQYQEVYVLLYSLYRHVANKRDLANAPG